MEWPSWAEEMQSCDSWTAASTAVLSLCLVKGRQQWVLRNDFFNGINTVQQYQPSSPPVSCRNSLPCLGHQQVLGCLVAIIGVLSPPRSMTDGRGHYCVVSTTSTSILLSFSFPEFPAEYARRDV